jgi:hypothetical protein
MPLPVAVSASAKEKQPKTYPEQGKVIAMKTSEQTHTTPVYTDPYGKTHGGSSHIRYLPIFRIETETRQARPEAKGSQIHGQGKYEVVSYGSYFYQFHSRRKRNSRSCHAVSS